MSTVVHYRWGGFVISRQAAAEWASRITGKTYTDRQYWAIQTAIQPKVRVLNADFKLVGESREEMGFMIVTRTERLIDYKLGSPVPPFPEGEREAMAKPLLEGEGVTDYAFMTIHSGIRVKSCVSTVVHYRWGGFVISRQAAAEWASRITGKTYTDRQYWAIQTAIQPKVRVFNADFKLVGESREEMGFMIVTRTERLIDYKLGSPVPPFPEGEREAMAKPLLEGEGVTDYVFTTIHSGIQVA